MEGKVLQPHLFGISWLDSYVVFAVLGMVAAVLVGFFRRKRFDVDWRDIFGLVCSAIIGIVVGGKLLFIITEIPAVVNHGFSAEIIESRVLNSGFVFYGGVIGAYLFTLLYAKLVKKDKKTLLNFVTPCYTAFHALGRIGCLFAGCCYGVEAEFGIKRAGENFYRVPVQLIEAICLVIITVLLIIYENDRIKRGKKYFAVIPYILLYAPTRFVLEFFRGDKLRGVFDVNVTYATTDGTFAFAYSLSTSQIISLVLLTAVGIYGLLRLFEKRLNKKEKIKEKEQQNSAQSSEKSA